MTEEDKLAIEPLPGTEPPPGGPPELLPPVSSDTEPFVPAAPAAAAPAAAAPTAPAAAAPLPPVGWQAPPVVVATKGERTTAALAAGLLLILGGVGGILIGLLVAIVGGPLASSVDFSQFSNSPDLNGANASALAGGVVAFIGAVVAVYSIAYLLAGIGVVRNANSARVLGIVIGTISGLFWLLGLVNANRAQNVAGASGGGILFVALAVAVHVYIVVALLFFWRNKQTVA